MGTGASGSPARPPKFAEPKNIINLGVYLAAALALSIYLLLEFWPTTGEDLNQVQVLIVVLMAGAVGSLIHSLRSFVVFVGNRQLVTSWIPFYVLRPASGAAMALVFYLVLGDALLGTKVGEEDFSITAVAALAALVGLFSDMSADKLKDVFQALIAPTRPGS